MSFLREVNRKMREIRRSDRRTRRNWLVGSTAVAMIIIIALWVGYLNVTVSKIARNGDVKEEIPVEEKGTDENSVFSVFSRGFKETARSASEIFGKLTDKVSEIFSGAKERLENIKEYAPEGEQDNILN
jgi:methyl-accepting chemotaxis protein